MRERRRCVVPDGDLSVRRQCELLALNRSSLYYQCAGVDTEDLALMRRIDELHLKYPFYGSRRVSQALRSQGLVVNRKRAQRLMRIMGLEGLAPKPNTSKRSSQHAVYPYLLRGLSIHRPNQVWAADITYVPLARGFAYLVAIMDWWSRRVLAWRLSNTLDTTFCVEALEEALVRFGQPEIFNTDQGSQFTAEAFTGVLLARGIKISMDGKGHCIDNVFVERLWRSVKYGEVYLNAYDSLVEARSGIGLYLGFYNDRRRIRPSGTRPPRASTTASSGRLRNAMAGRGCGSCRCCGRAKRTARPQRLGKRFAFPTATTALVVRVTLVRSTIDPSRLHLSQP